MSDENTIVRERQRAIRREMDRRGISIKAVQFDGGWKAPSTVLSYFPASDTQEPATMSVAALFRLINTNALPTDLLSLLLPAGHVIVKVPEGVDHDDVEGACRDYLQAKGASHQEKSECGREIGPGERDLLDSKVAYLRARA